jgi:adenine-specific DNA methylase
MSQNNLSQYNSNSFQQSFIESQFPVSKISKESYKERKANYSQTLTGLGKWWGRKPLILVRAAILGLLLPATDNPEKDREIFLKILTMDDEGMWQRKKSNIPAKVLKEYLSPREEKEYLDGDSVHRGLSRKEKEELQKLVFLRMGYDERLKYCYRPEEIEGPSPKTWKEINEYLNTKAASIPELTEELGIRQFGERPSVGDCFCGGGSIPFEAARMGCDVFASDLNPVAALLTWASLNIIGGGEEVVEEVKKAQQEVYDAVDKQITEWGIEHNEKGWRADAYLYCNEVVCPECGWKVPLLPTMVIGEGSKTIAEIIPDPDKKRYDIIIRQGVSSEELRTAKSIKIIENSKLRCPNSECPGHLSPISIKIIRRENSGGLRLWENEDIIPRPEDVFQERLYCVRWVEEYKDANNNSKTRKHYLAPDELDFAREDKVIALLRENFSDWQEKGFLPSMMIESGYNTDQPIREKGWTHWHHLFTPRQLLQGSLINKYLNNLNYENNVSLGLLLSNLNTINWNSKLSRCHTSATNEGIIESSLYNQAFNTLYTYGGRSILSSENVFSLNIKPKTCSGHSIIKQSDSRFFDDNSKIYITDPPYADAIVYHELSEFFLAWCEKSLNELFPDWYTDSKRALAVTGSDEEFRKNMVEIYRNLTNHMPDNGAQIVMFTHQDANVWADLAMILWAAGLQVTAAWCIATETDSAGLKKGNYVKGTVLLILRKQTSEETAFLDEIYPEVEAEVKNQLDSMLKIDDKDDPNFGDTDYQLAAYAAALRVLTKYKQIEDIDIVRELNRTRSNGDKNPLEAVIENAVKIACDYLVPVGIESWIWKQLTPEERFYIKGLELESHGEYRNGAYQELARGFGIREYRNLQESQQANQARLKTASEFRDRDLGGEGFSSSLVRQILFAIRQTVQEEDPKAGRAWLKDLPEYWDKRQDIIELLQFIASFETNDSMGQWKSDAKAAKMLAVVVRDDHI